MVDAATIVISIGGSGVVNLISLWYQRATQRSDRINQAKEDWYREVKSDAKKIRRICQDLPVGEKLDDSLQPVDDDSIPRLNRLIELVDAIQSKADSAPPEVSKDVVDEIEELNYWFQFPETDDRYLSTIDVRETAKRQSECILDNISEDSDRIDNPY